MPEEEILERYNVAPGILRAKLSNWRWVCYAAIELAKLERMPTKELKRLERRISYGVRSELLPLVELKGIGRVRARKLFTASLRTIGDLERVPAVDLARIIGPRTAESIKGQLGQDVHVEEKRTGQTKLK